MFCLLQRCYLSHDLQEESNINNTVIKALQKLYGNTAQVKTGNILSHPFNISKGLRQGCCISPTLLRFTYEKL